MTTQPLASQVQAEITRLSQLHNVEPNVFQEFALLVLASTTSPKKATKSKPKAKKIKALTLPQLKAAVLGYFEAKDAKAMQRSGTYKMATDGMESLNFSYKASWEILYRKFIGVLPNELDQEGYGCINGINIFEYSRPWDTFGLNPKSATIDDIKQSYRSLSKIYHPDNAETGDAKIFDRLNTLYRSICAEA
ncbi:MAG: J domain-containing protein [Elainellaceae cyanobacterium]